MRCLNKKVKLIFSVEHAKNTIPKDFSYLFRGNDEILKSHRGYDIGVLSLAKKISKYFNTQLFYGKYSRLLIDLNRSENHKKIFSEFTDALDRKSKNEIIEKFYVPYRNSVEKKIDYFIKRKYFVIHISFHSFTPVLNGKTRNFDIGLLFDPAREYEYKICSGFKKKFLSINNIVKIYFNKPYRGTTDGFTSYLRKKFKSDFYAGIELEINQKHFTNKKI